VLVAEADFEADVTVLVTVATIEIIVDIVMAVFRCCRQRMTLILLSAVTPKARKDDYLRMSVNVARERVK
jgi:hypothetical protein